MIKMKPETESFLREHFSEQDVERMLSSDDMDDILGPLDAFITAEGFEVDWILNDLGRTGQRAYDDIYYSNVNKKDE